MFDPCPFRPETCDCPARPCGVAVEYTLSQAGIRLRLDEKGQVHAEPRTALPPALVTAMHTHLPYMIVLAARQDMQRLCDQQVITSAHCRVPLPSFTPLNAACVGGQPDVVRKVALAWIAAWRTWLTTPTIKEDV